MNLLTLFLVSLPLLGALGYARRYWRAYREFEAGEEQRFREKVNKC